MEEENIDYCFNDTKTHIKSLKFNSTSLNETCIKNMQDWKDLAKFSILTGVNGSGKSQILAHIKKWAKTPKLIFYDFQSEFEIYIRQEDDHSTSNFLRKTSIDDIEKEIRSYLDKKKDQLQIKSFLHSILTQEQFDDIHIELDKLVSNADGRLKEESIKRIINNISQVYESKCSLIKIFQKFENCDRSRNEMIEKIENNSYIPDISKLQEFHQQTYPNQTDFLEKLKDPNKSLYKEYANSLFKYPLNEINNDLRIFDFKIEKCKSSNNLFENYCIKKLSDESIRIKKPSSGEMFILSMIASKYELTNEMMYITTPDVILLDEVDRHFHPEFINRFFVLLYECFYKKNIQIIMTTHRTDTLSLVPTEDKNIQIFSIEENNGIRSIKRNTQLQAMFRLTKNTREFFNIKSNVYVEALDDHRLYDGIYQALYDFCEFLRYDEVKRKKFLGSQESGLNLSNDLQHLLSRRYQLQFFSCARFSTGGAGGCSQVFYSVERDLVTYDSIQINCKKKKLIPSKLNFPFGVIDRDVDNINKIRDKGHEMRITTFDRYSIENYIFDPVMLLKHKDNLKKFIEKHACNSNFKNVLISYLDDPNKSLDDYFRVVFDLIMKYNNNKNDKKKAIYNYIVNRQTNPNHYFDFTNDNDFIYLIRKIHSMDRNIRIEFHEINNYLYNYLKANLNKQQYVILEHNGTDVNWSLREYEIPEWFIEIKGHIIGDACISEMFGNSKDLEKKFFDTVLNEYNNFPCIISTSLVKIFFKLNSWVRKQARDIIKPTHF